MMKLFTKRRATRRELPARVQIFENPSWERPVYRCLFLRAKMQTM